VLTIDGAPYVAAYTSEEEFDAAGRSGLRVNPPVRELVQSLPETIGLAINPGGTVGLPIAGAFLRQLWRIGSVVGPGTAIRIGDPATEPDELLTSLVSAFAELREVHEARRAWAVVGEGHPGLVVGVDLDPDGTRARHAVLAAVRDVVGHSSAAFPVDVVFTSDGGPLVEWMLSNTDPFYAARSGSTPHA
jgi:hypothetical protein